MTKIYEVPKDAAERALVTADQYTEMYQRSVDDNEAAVLVPDPEESQILGRTH